MLASKIVAKLQEKIKASGDLNVSVGESLDNGILEITGITVEKILHHTKEGNSFSYVLIIEC